jgi:hypothetical protein
MTLIVKPGFNGMTDADAIAYVNAVEAADGQLLEFGVGAAINDFVVGCKLDGIWSAIKASCILAGARTLSGALVPLAGTAPTNFNFVSGDYNRKTGLVGNETTKFLNSNRSNGADPQDNRHMAVFPTVVVATGGKFFMGGSGATTNQRMEFAPQSTGHLFRCLNNSFPAVGDNTTSSNKLIGMSRSASASFVVRVNNTSSNNSFASNAVGDNNVLVFATNAAGQTGVAAQNFSAHRLAFYSIGESLDLALLDARVTTLVNAIGAAIP